MTLGGGRIVRYSLLVLVFGLAVSQVVYGGHLSLGRGFNSFVSGFV